MHVLTVTAIADVGSYQAMPFIPEFIASASGSLPENALHRRKER